MNARFSFFSIYIAAFINIVSFTMVFPLLPIYAKEFNASNLEIGLLAASFALAQLMFSVLWGALSDKFGRKPIIAIGLLGIGTGFVVFGMATNIVVFFAARFAQGIFSAATLPASRAYIADVTTKKERVRAMGRLGAAIALGIILGPAIGGILAQQSISLPFFAAAIVAYLNFLFVVLFLPESIKAKSSQAIKIGRVVLGNFTELHRGLRGSLAPLLLLAFVWSFAFSNNSVAVPLLGLEKFHLDAGNIGMLFTLIGIVSVITQVSLLTKIVSRLGERLAAVVGLGTMALGFVLMPFLPPQIIFLYIAAAIVGLGSAVSKPVITALISKKTPGEQGKIMGVANAFESFGSLLGPIMGGLLFSFGSQLPFVFSGIAVIAVLAFTIIKGHFLVQKPSQT